MKTNKRRENKAVEAIICGILRGFGAREWKKVFRKVDEIEARKRTVRKNI